MIQFLPAAGLFWNGIAQRWTKSEQLLKLDFQNISGLRRVYFILETIQVQLEAMSTSLVQ